MLSGIGRPPRTAVDMNPAVRADMLSSRCYPEMDRQRNRGAPLTHLFHDFHDFIIRKYRRRAPGENARDFWRGRIAYTKSFQSIVKRRTCTTNSLIYMI